eukprot:gene32252-16818_t
MSFPLSIGQEREISHALDKRIESEVDHVPLNYPWEVENEQDRPSDLLQRHAVHMKKKYREACATFGFLDWLQVILPCVSWLRTYKWKQWLICDITAGLSVGFMVIPQGLSYAGLAGLPAVYGLYGAFLPCIIYTLFGSSRQLAVGPVAVTSLIISANLQRIVSCANAIDNPNKPPVGLEACQEQYNKAAIQLAFIVSMMYTGVGILRLGWVTKFLSHAVISGFTTGAAVVIGMGQVKYLLGYSVVMGHSTRLQDYITQYIAGEAHRINNKMRYIRSFGPLLMCVVGLCSVYIGKVNTPERGYVKDLPGLTISWWTPMTDPSFADLFPTAIVVMIVDLLESTSIARALARKNGYELVYNREIIGLGMANIVGAAFNCYTTTGSFSRSAVNNLAGAKTPPLAQGQSAACSVMFVLLF